MIDTLGYIISSHVDYQQPLERLLASMAYIDPTHITVVIGGAQTRSKAQNTLHRTFYVPHNSFDYNGLIDFVEYQWELASHIICLHDTMEFGPNTNDLLKHVHPDHYGTAVFGGQCNLVTYRADYLFAHRNYILSMKDCTKYQAIYYEGTLFRMILEHHAGSYNSTCEILGVDRPYSGAERLKEYYAAIDLIKWKANHGQTNPSNYIIGV